MKHFWLFVLACAGISYSGNAQQLSLASSLIPENTVEESPSSVVSWTEEEQKRTVHSRTWLSDDGQIKILNSLRAVNYEREPGRLIPIEADLKQLPNGNWAALQQPYPTFLQSNGSFQVSVGTSATLTFLGDTRINGTPQKQVPRVEGNTVDFGTNNNCTKLAEFRENGIKYGYSLNTPPTSGSPFLIEETIVLPEGYLLQIDPHNGSESDFGWAGDLWVSDSKGTRVGTLFAPLCFDENKVSTLGSYRLEKKGNSYNLQLIVPGAWLNAPDRAYPVIIDPLVVGPLASWTGGTMPSCFNPTYNQDSILVTIPGGITVTQLNVTASFYADPFTPALMSQGRMFFSTSCGNTQVFSISGPNGNLAGTAYLDSFDLHSPLTCCYAESCNDQTFYLSFHLMRMVNGSGCNTTYIRYDPFTTSWPYQAVVVGKTPESYSAQWSVSPVPICSNTCTINGTAYVYYGVPPYTFTHPWSTDVITIGTNVGCASGATSHNFTLDIPNCPSYCDENFTSLDVPPAIIVDACGTAVSGLPTKIVPIKPAPQVTASYTADLCSGSSANIQFTPCIAGAAIQWNGNGTSGTSDILDTLYSTDSVTTYTFLATASLNGCDSDTLTVDINIHPVPTADFNYTPEPIVSSIGGTFNDQTNFYGSTGVLWAWDMGDETTYIGPNNFHSFTSPGEYLVCLEVVDIQGCVDSICKMVPVVPAAVEIPNVVTANNDGVNDLLIFNYLEFYPDNELVILNRWGNEIYHTSNYQNNWNGIETTEGTYFFILKVNNLDEQYEGFFQLVK